MPLLICDGVPVGCHNGHLCNAWSTTGADNRGLGVLTHAYRRGCNILASSLTLFANAWRRSVDGDVLAVSD